MQNILLIHGALGAKQDLQALGEVLKKAGHNVSSFSFSGHGKEAFQHKFTIAQFTTELKSFIVKNELTPVSIFGYSMGGYVALNLAAFEQGLINKIITLGTKFNWSTTSVDKETKQLNPELVFQKVPTFAKSLEDKHGLAWKELMDKTAAMMRDINAVNYINSETLKKITIPILIGIADRDQMVSLDETTEVFKTLPTASMFMLPGSKHQLETINLNLLTQIITDFCRS